MNITLIGYRGTGKSTIAVPLAERLGWDAIDADVELERRAGRTIQQIFASDGEPEFRRLERATLVDLLARDRLVIAAGGGAIQNPDTRRDMRAAGPVIWLRASIETIERRLFGDETTAQRRPNLTATGGRSEIEELLLKREPLYHDTATITVTTDEPLPGQSTLPDAEALAEYLIDQLAGPLSAAVSNCTEPSTGRAAGTTSTETFRTGTEETHS